MENMMEHEMKTLRPRKGIVGAVLAEDTDFSVTLEDQMDKKSENGNRNYKFI